MQELSRRFRKRVEVDRSRLAELAHEVGDGNALLELRQIAHRLAGNAGLFGFSDIGTAAQPLDDLLTEKCTDNALIQRRLTDLIAQIDKLVEAA